MNNNLIDDQTSKVKKVLIISDQIPGHFNQSIGICSLLNENIEVNYAIIEMQWRIHVLRFLFRIFSRMLCKNLTNFNSKLIVSFFKEIDVSGYDLLIASGGNTFFINAALSKLHGIPNIQLGSPRGIKSELFNAHLTAERYSNSKNNIVYDVTPSKYSPKACISNNEIEKKILLLFGGNGIGYEYSDRDIKNITETMNSLTEKNKKELICVTSRRSKENHENILRQNLNNLSKRSIWFHRGGENADLRDLFSLSDFIFVTEDSAMMISESISSGKTVTTLFPEKVVTPKRYKNHINLYLNKGFISRSKIGDQLVLRKNNEHSQKIEESRKKLLNQILCNIGLQ